VSNRLTYSGYASICDRRLFCLEIGFVGYFDIHPPLGKLILAYGGYLLGYRPDPTFIIGKIGDAYPSSINFVALRCVSAIFGTATVPMSYLVARALALSRASSVLCGCLVLTDIIGTIEGRLILMDSQLLFFVQLALLSALKLWQSRPRSRQRMAYLVITGFVSGMAMSIKHTALATPGLIAMVSFLGGHFLSEPMALPECCVAALAGLVAYALPFYPLLTRAWKTGDKYDNFMPLEFRRTIVNAADYDPTCTRPSFWRMLVSLNRRMVTSNASVKKRHAWESHWYEWIINWRGVLYYSSRTTDEHGVQIPQAIVYLIGNPVVCACCLVSLVLFTGWAAVLARMEAFPKASGRATIVPRDKVLTGIFLLGGWICNLMPYALIERSSFLYHYLPGLFYAQLLCAHAVDMLPKRLRVIMVSILCLATVSGFLYWSPWIYSWPLTGAEHASRRLLPRWD
jgi:dolichyl-phosphate-mannose--protein O-mannosyl transferase